MTKEEFTTKYLQGFNEQQHRAATEIDGPVLLLAVPGSGKTTVLITRIAYMVLCAGIQPENILAVTYTVAATKEMNLRLNKLIGEKYAGRLEFRTINGICAKILSIYSSKFGKGQPFELIDNEAESAKIITDVYREINQEFATESIIKEIRTAITYIKNNELELNEIDEIKSDVRNLKDIFCAYNEKLRILKKMDYDDQMVYAKTILEKFPVIRSEIQEKYKYICVDEAQDTSKIQHSIIRILASKYNNIFMVGDEDQSIYGFRAAYPEALTSFEKDFLGGKVLFMETNYRSSKEIINLSDAFISENTARYKKNIIPARGNVASVNLIEVKNRFEQFNKLVSIAERCEEQTAVLYRNNDSAIPLIDMLERKGISYNSRRMDPSFFSHRIVMDISDILQLSINPKDTDRFMHIYYKLGYYISKPIAEYVCTNSRRKDKSVFDELICFLDNQQKLRENAIELKSKFRELEKKAGSQAINYVISELNYGKYISENSLDFGKTSILFMIAHSEKNIQGVLRRLEELKKIIQTHENTPETKFILSTIHSSKGLEYNSVYIIDVVDGVFPGIAKSSCKTTADKAEYEEDRRIFYVGITRAKNNLHIFCCKEENSEFVEETKRILKGKSSDNLFSLLKSKEKENVYIGDCVTHIIFGSGRVVAVRDDVVTIRFLNSHYGEKSFQLDAFRKKLIKKERK